MAKEQDTSCIFFPSQELTKYCTRYSFSYVVFILLLLQNRSKRHRERSFQTLELVFLNCMTRHLKLSFICMYIK